MLPHEEQLRNDPEDKRVSHPGLRVSVVITLHVFTWQMNT